MDFLVMQRQLRAARRGRMAFGMTLGLMIAINGLLAAKLYFTSNQVVLVPSSLSDGMVARGAVDRRYMEALSLDAVYALYNVSPNTLSYGRQVIERVASVMERNSLLRRYDEVAEDIRDREISTVFAVERIEHNPEALEVIVEGRLQTFLDTVLVSIERRRIQLAFVLEAGSVRLAGINRLQVSE